MAEQIEKNGPHVVDVHVGAAVRLRRKALNLTQQEVAAAIGLTFQQLQKYEKGTNRISASKLYELSRFLKVPIEWFFRGVDDQDGEFSESHSERTVSTFLQTREGVELAQAFPSIRKPNLRRKVLALVRDMADD